MKYIDLTNKKFGKLLVIERVPAPKHIVNKKLTYFKCLCDCGKEIIVIGADIRGNRTTSCGCQRLKKVINLSGQKFGKLTVLSYVKAPEHLSEKSKKAAYFLCNCSCGNKTIIRGSSLKTGKINSCGCSSNFIDITGQTFGKLKVIKKIDTPHKIKDKNRAYFLCQCDCGKLTNVAGKELRSGYRKSCGCNRKHTEKDRPRLSSARAVYRAIYRDGDLLFEDFLILSQQNCFYCNDPPSNLSNVFKNRSSCTSFAKEYGNFIYNGLDRIDSNLPHNKDNVVPCCYSCNIMKLDMSVIKFKEHIQKIYNYYIRKQ